MRQRISLPLLTLTAALLVGSCSASENNVVLRQGRTLKADNGTAKPSSDNSSVVFQVDTGNLFSAFQDSSGQLWQADFNYLGGNTEGTKDPTANASQSDAQMLSTNRVGPSFLYDFGPINRLLPNTTYNVTLFFNEIYWSAPGARLFNISANNHTIATNYDIFSEAGGRDAACNLTFTVTTGQLAQLELQFVGVRDNAALAGIQVSGPAAPSFQIQSFLQKDTPSLGKLLVRIDAGRSIKAGNYTASNGDVWVYDRLYQGGGTESFNYVIKNATDPDSTLYDTNRVGGAFQYGFTPAQGIQPGANYTVVLRAADLYWSYTGQRIFSVSANGVPVLTNYDVIAEAGGPHAAAVATFPVTADSTGAIALTWIASKDQAIVGGLELYEAGSSTAGAPAVAPAAAPASGPESATSAAAAPAYAPPSYGATDLQAAAPAAQPSAAALAASPAPAAAPAYGPAYVPSPAYGGSYGGYGYSPSTPGSYGGYGTGF